MAVRVRVCGKNLRVPAGLREGEARARILYV
jgi:hypothetical protein